MPLAKIFKALSEEPRLQILALLRQHELSGAEIMSILEMGQSRVSRHLAVLRDVGLVDARRDGSWVYFKANEVLEEGVQELIPAIADALKEELTDRIHEKLQAALLRRKATVSQFFDEKAVEWDRLRGQASDELSVLKLLAPVLPRNLNIVDLGTGTGALLPYLAEYCAHLIGVDSSAAMLEAAQLRLLEAGISRVLLLRAELESLPFEQNSLDVAICHMVLHYTAEPQAVICEMARIIRTGGWISIADLMSHQHEELRETLAHQRLGFSKKEIEEWFGKAGIRWIDFRTGNLNLGEHRLQTFYACGKKE